MELWRAPTRLASGSGRLVTATIEDAAGNTVNDGADATLAVSFAKDSGTGTVSNLGSNAAVAGVATKTVTGVLAGPITLKADATATGGAITTANADKLSLDRKSGVEGKTGQPGATSDLTCGTARLGTATIEDAAANTMNGCAEASRAVSCAKDSGTGTVSNLGSNAAVAGVATKTVTGVLAGPITLKADATATGGAITTANADKLS